MSESASDDRTARLRALHRLAYVTTIVVFVTVAAGSFVRAAGAGLGCHSWPKCFEWSWFPPTSMDQVPEAERHLISIPKAWIEYLNRLIGASLGLFILATWWKARAFRDRKDIWKPICWSVVLVILEGILGGIVVRYHLDHRLVSLHLFGGLLLAVLLVYVTANTALAAPVSVARSSWTPLRAKLHGWTNALLWIVIGNEVVGAIVRGAIETIEETRPDLTRCQWIDEVGAVDWIHRKLALVTLLAVIALVVFARRSTESDSALVGRLATQNAALAILQIAAGIVLAYMGLPPWAQVIHVTCGVLLVGNLFRQSLVLRRAGQGA
jgi:cytochrome c oxidase assembly protein subunit 15